MTGRRRPCHNQNTSIKRIETITNGTEALEVFLSTIIRHLSIKRIETNLCPHFIAMHDTARHNQNTSIIGYQTPSRNCFTPRTRVTIRTPL